MILRSVLAAVVLVLLLCATGQTAGQKGEPLYYGSGSLSLTPRTGYFVLPAASARQELARPRALLGGFGIGRRYPLTPLMRLAVGLVFDFGSFPMDTLGTLYFDRFALFHAGLEPELQVVLPVDGPMTPYLFAGGGLHFVRWQQHFFLVSDPQQEVRFNDLEPESFKQWTPGVQGGLGLDYLFNPELGFSLRYQARYWHPFKRSFGMDLFEPVDYWESSFTHQFSLQLLFLFGK